MKLSIKEKVSIIIDAFFSTKWREEALMRDQKNVNVHITKSNLRVYCTSCLSKPYPDSRHPYGSGERDFPSVELSASKPSFLAVARICYRANLPAPKLLYGLYQMSLTLLLTITCSPLSLSQTNACACLTEPIKPFSECHASVAVIAEILRNTIPIFWY